MNILNVRELKANCEKGITEWKIPSNEFKKKYSPIPASVENLQTKNGKLCKRITQA